MADTYYDANDQPINQQYFDANDQPIPPQSLFRKPPKEFGIAKVAKEALPDALPMLGGIAGSLTSPITGPGGPIAGAMIGAVAKNHFQPDDTFTETAKHIGLDTLTQGVLPELVGPAAGLAKTGTRNRMAAFLRSKFTQRVFPSVGEAVTQAKGAAFAGKKLFPEADVIETAAQNAQDTHNAYLVQNGPSSVPSPMHQSEVGQDLLKVPYQQTSPSDTSISALADKSLKDVTQVRNFKFATGEPDTISQLATSKAIRAGYVPGGKFNANKILAELNGDSADVYNEALKPAVRKNLTDVLTALKDNRAGANFKNSTVRYIGNRLAFDAATGLATATGGPLAGGAVGGTLFFGDYALGKIASNPEMSKLIIAGTKTAKNSPAGQFIQKAIKYQLPRVLGEGAKLTIKNTDGEEEDAIVKDGQITTVPNR